MLDIAVMVLLGAASLVALAAVVNIVRVLRPTSKPGVNSVLAALEPYVYRAILAAEKLAFDGLDTLQIKIEGEDKKAIADSVYDALPDFLMVGPVPVPVNAVRYLVPRERFEALVEDIYSAADAFITRNEVYLKSQVDALVIDARAVA